MVVLECTVVSSCDVFEKLSAWFSPHLENSVPIECICSTVVNSSYIQTNAAMWRKHEHTVGVTEVESIIVITQSVD